VQKFGGRKPRGVRPERFQKASGGIIRSVFQQLEAMKIIEQSEKGGRIITPDGQRDLDRIAARVEPDLSMSKSIV